MYRTQGEVLDLKGREAHCDSGGGGRWETATEVLRHERDTQCLHGANGVMGEACTRSRGARGGLRLARLRPFSSGVEHRAVPQALSCSAR